MGVTTRGDVYLASQPGYSTMRDGLELAVSGDDGASWTRAASAEPLPTELGTTRPAFGISASGTFEAYAPVSDASATRIIRVRRSFNGDSTTAGAPAGIGTEILGVSAATASSVINGLTLFPKTMPNQTGNLLGLALSNGSLTSVSESSWDPVVPADPTAVVPTAAGALPLSNIAYVATSPSGKWTTFNATKFGETAIHTFVSPGGGAFYDLGVLPTPGRPLVDDSGVVRVIADIAGTTCNQVRTVEYWFATSWYGPTHVGWGCGAQQAASVSATATFGGTPVPVAQASIVSGTTIRLYESPGREWLVSNPGSTGQLVMAAGDFLYAYSSSAGMRWDLRNGTWAAITLPALTGSNAFLTTAANGTDAVYLVRSTFAAPAQLKVWRSDDHGLTWVDVMPSLVSPAASFSQQPAFALTADGRLQLYDTRTCTDAAYLSRWTIPLTPGGTWSAGETLWTSPTKTVTAPVIPTRAAVGSDDYQTVFARVGNDTVALPINVAAPSGSFGLNTYAAMSGTVNLSLGNLARTETDIDVPTVGLPLQLSRSYNSGDARVGIFGKGWSTPFEMRAGTNCATGGVTIVYPDGRAEEHPLQGGSYRNATGYGSTLTKPNATTYRLVQPDGSRYDFNTSTGRIQALADPAGRTQTVTFNASGQPTTIADTVSGRTLTLAYTANKVTQLTTTAVTVNGTAAGLVWRYGYVGDQLERVCAATAPDLVTGDCTLYTSTDGRLSSIIDPLGHTTLAVGYDSAGRVAWQDDALQRRTSYERPTPSQVNTIDPLGHTTIATYDSMYRQTTETDASGGAQTFGYDANGFRNHLVNQTGGVTDRTFDSAGRVLSESINGATTYYSYDTAGNVVAQRDPRSSGPTDTRYQISSNWDPTTRALLSRRMPDQTTGTVYTYTSGTEAAIGGGTMPANLLRTSVTETGMTTVLSYDSKGNLRKVVDPAGLTKNLTVDELGRTTAVTEVSDSFPAGVTTSYTYDAVGRIRTVTAPAVINPVTLLSHQQRVTLDYDAAGRLLQTTSDDIASGTPDPSRQTTYTYDAAGQVTAEHHLGATGDTSYVYDNNGNVTRITDPLGRSTTTVYDPLNRPVTRIQQANATYGPSADTVLETTEYNATGQVVATTDALGRRTETTYDASGRVTTRKLIGYHQPNGTVSDLEVDRYSYDPAGLIIEESHGDAKLVTTRTYDTAGRLATSASDPAGRNAVTTYQYDKDGHTTRVTLTAGGRTLDQFWTYDAAGRPISHSVDNGATDLIDTTTYDQRGLVRTTTDPRGNQPGGDPNAYTTTFAYDQMGRETSRTTPPIPVSTNGSTPTLLRPIATTGYNAFGDQTHQRDLRGLTTTSTFDQLGRRTGVALPTTTNSSGATVTSAQTFVYDDAGNPIELIDPTGASTSWTYDYHNLPTARLDPSTNGVHPQWSFEYDAAGNLTATIDPTGARTEHTYTERNQIATSTALVRRQGLSSLALTDHYAYDSLGQLATHQDASGETWTQSHNALGETTATTDPAAGTITMAYGLPQELQTRTDPMGRSTELAYDAAGRPIATTRRGTDGTVLGTVTAEYDAAGNLASTTTARGNASTQPTDYRTAYAWDALNRLTSVSEPRSTGPVTTAQYRYNANGQVTGTLDGNNHLTTHSYNERGEHTGTTEPATTLHPDLNNRTWLTDFDSRGLPVRERQPGGIIVTRTYDSVGRPTGVAATDGATTTNQATTYDLAGRPVRLDSDSAILQVSYDDRGLVTSTAGSHSDASYSYNANGQLISATQPTGTTSYGWNSRGLLASLTTDSKTLAYTYNPAGDLTRVTLPGGAHRDLAYDAFGRLASDVISSAAGVTTASTTYGYDADDNLIAAHRSGAGRVNAGDQAYTYDRAGRLATWTNPSGTPTAYAWDNAGNLVADGTTTLLYDERNRLISASDSRSFAYSPRGDLIATTTSGSTTTSSFDPLGRLTSTAGTPITYDALNRPLSVGAASVTYSGLSNDPTGFGNDHYTYDPAGNLVAAAIGSGTNWWFTNPHHDPDLATTDNAQVAGSVAFTPLGRQVAASGDLLHLGFQSDLTEASTGLTWMGARWFSPATDSFVSRDIAPAQLKQPVTLNRYTYGNNNPVANWDPTGATTERVRHTRPRTTDDHFTWANQPTTGYITVAPPPKTGWQRLGDLRDGFVSGLQAPFKLLALPVMAVADLGICARHELDNYGCFETVKTVGSGLKTMVTHPEILIEQCTSNIERCLGEMVGTTVSFGALGRFANIATPVMRNLGQRGLSKATEVLKSVSGSPLARDTDQLLASANNALEPAAAPGGFTMSEANTGGGVSNPVPDRLARVVDADFIGSPTLGGPGGGDVFVTAADDISGMSSAEIGERLTLLDAAGKPRSGPFAVLEFDTPASGLASPINRTNPGFVQGGTTAGGAREFVLPNLSTDGLVNLVRRQAG